MNENGKALVKRVKEFTIKEQGSKRQKMVIDFAFLYLKTVGDKEARNQNELLKARNKRTQSIRIEVAFASSYFSSKTVRPSCQSSNALQFMQAKP